MSKIKKESKPEREKREAFIQLVQSIKDKDLSKFLEKIKEIQTKYKQTNSKIIDQLFEYNDENGLNLFNYCYQNGSIELIKHLINKNKTNILAELASGKTPLEIVQGRFEEDRNDENTKIVSYIKNKSEVEKNTLLYKKNLFELDLKIINKINNLLKSIKQDYENNNFLNKVQESKYLIHLDELPDEIISNIKGKIEDNSYYQFKLIKHLQQIGEYIGTLNTYEDSILVTNKNNIPWELLRSIHVDLTNNSLMKDNPHKLFESISYDMIKLAKNFSELTEFFDKGYDHYKSKKESSTVSYKKLSQINFVSHNTSLMSPSGI